MSARWITCPECGCDEADVREEVAAMSSDRTEYVHVAECFHCDHQWEFTPQEPEL